MPYRIADDERQRWLAEGWTEEEITALEAEREYLLAEEEAERRWQEEHELRSWLHDSGNWRL